MNKLRKGHFAASGWDDLETPTDSHTYNPH